ncbi:hypothetical protein AG1IA_06492 [Rhizoctonia solani AG-1 IA]|uniref:Transmembrane protein n=1 Tax=Thanatephorus cucumeris (strain AG1-IA) TaxID=983506 RepID=L8WSV5_THACA|nr:hypothetical protein AG1IA_06492 [Rhizoctonia solani AG-1 IA]
MALALGCRLSANAVQALRSGPCVHGLLGIRCFASTVPQEWGDLPLLSTTMFSSQRISYKTPLFLWIISQVAGGTSGRAIPRGNPHVWSLHTCRDSAIQANNGMCRLFLMGPSILHLRTMSSSPVYSLMSACAACQGASYGTWGQWTANCPAGLINNGTFPFQVPADTAMPQWALKMIGPDSYFDSEAARGGDSLSGATVFLIVLLPILLIGIAGIMAWVWWQRRKRRARSGSMAGKEPLLRSAGSRQTIISVDTTSDIQIHLTRKSMGSLHSQYEYDRQYTQPSPVPTTPESAGYSSHPSPAVSSPGAQYAYYPEPPGYQPNQQFLVPPSAATSLGFNPQYHSTAPPQPNPPLTGATAQTFASQIESAPGRRASEPVVVENDSGTFPRTPVEPQLRALPLDDMPIISNDMMSYCNCVGLIRLHPEYSICFHFAFHYHPRTLHQCDICFSLYGSFTGIYHSFCISLIR